MREKGVEIVNKRINAKRTKVNKDKRITYIATKGGTRKIKMEI